MSKKSKVRAPGQLPLPLPNRWGGARKGAGRKPRDPNARRNVPHVRRPPHKSRFPTLVTLRARRIGSLRQQRVREALRTALWRQSRRPYAGKFHVVHFSIQDDHVHLIVEGQDPGSADERDILRRGLTGLASSLARLINKVLERRGGVWADRHHRRDLKTPTEVRNALVYVLQNWKHHGTLVFGHGVVDHFSSAPRFDGWDAPPIFATGHDEAWPRAAPRTWLLRIGWTRAERSSSDPRLDIATAPKSPPPAVPIVREER